MGIISIEEDFSSIANLREFTEKLKFNDGFHLFFGKKSEELRQEFYGELETIKDYFELCEGAIKKYDQTSLIVGSELIKPVKFRGFANNNNSKDSIELKISKDVAFVHNNKKGRITESYSVSTECEKPEYSMSVIDGKHIVPYKFYSSTNYNGEIIEDSFKIFEIVMNKSH